MTSDPRSVAKGGRVSRAPLRRVVALAGIFFLTAWVLACGESDKVSQTQATSTKSTADDSRTRLLELLERGADTPIEWESLTPPEFIDLSVIEQPPPCRDQVAAMEPAFDAATVGYTYGGLLSIDIYEYEPGRSAGVQEAIRRAVDECLGAHNVTRAGIPVRLSVTPFPGAPIPAEGAIAFMGVSILPDATFAANLEVYVQRGPFIVHVAEYLAGPPGFVQDGLRSGLLERTVRDAVVMMEERLRVSVDDGVEAAAAPEASSEDPASKGDAKGAGPSGLNVAVPSRLVVGRSITFAQGARPGAPLTITIQVLASEGGNQALISPRVRWEGERAVFVMPDHYLVCSGGAGECGSYQWEDGERAVVFVCLSDDCSRHETEVVR